MAVRAGLSSHSLAEVLERSRALGRAIPLGIAVRIALEVAGDRIVSPRAVALFSTGEVDAPGGEVTDRGPSAVRSVGTLLDEMIGDRPDAPAALREVVRGALAREYADGAAMRLALAMVLSSLGSGASSREVAAFVGVLFPSPTDPDTQPHMSPLERALAEEAGVAVPGPAEPVRLTAGEFELGEPIGRGGMGKLYRAKDAAGREVAVKVLRSDLFDESMVRRFEREAAARVEHPNVVRILGAGRASDGAPFIAMELLEGEDLATRLAAGPLEPEEAVRIGALVASGLEAVHRAGFVHRDVKPENVYLCAEGGVKILDFGIALRPTKETRLTRFGHIVGTPAYLSPEQARGQVEMDARADVWGLGAVLYRALSGRPPFERESDLATVVAVLFEDLTALRAVRATVPAALAKVVERALAKRPEDRYPSAAAFAEALRAADLHASPAAETLDLPTSTEVRVVSVALFEGLVNVAAVDRAVTAEGGRFLHVIGARGVGIFGAERSEGDEPLRAVRAAFASRGAARAVAVATGRAALGPGAVVGEAVRRAEQGCGLGQAGVVVDDPTSHGLPADLRRGVVVTGFFEVATASPSLTKASIVLSRPELPLFGREIELAQIATALGGAREGHATVVLCTGPPGIGKSRIRQEVQSLAARARYSSIKVARAEPGGWMPEASGAARTAGTPLLVEAAVSGGAFDPGATVEARREALLAIARAAIRDPGLATQCAEVLGETLGTPFPETPSLAAARSDPQVMTDRIRLAVGDLFEGLTEERALCLVLEDLQWADRFSLDLLDEVLDRLRDRPVFVFATARPEIFDEAPGLFSSHDLVRVDLRGLAAPAVQRLAAAVAGSPLREDLGRALADRTAGNPFFVEQIVVQLREQKRLDAPPEQAPLPLTVEAAVQSRLDHLPYEEKEACKRAAVWGRTFWLEGLAEVSEPAKVLGMLQRREVVSSRPRSRLAGTREYQFMSALVAEVAYGLLPDPARTRLHGKAAEFLATRRDAPIEELAMHLDRAGQTEKAADAYARAAAQASGRGDGGSVLRSSSRALELGAGPEHLFGLHAARADAYRHMGQVAQEESELDRALQVAGADADRTKVLLARASLLSRTGRTDPAMGVAEEAVAAARASGDADLFAVARASEAVSLAMGGRAAEAATAIAEATSRPAASALTRARVGALHATVVSLAGDVGASREAYQGALEAAREAGDVRRIALIESNLADLYARCGMYEDAEHALRVALDSCLRLRNRKTERYVRANLAHTLACLGRAEESLSALDEAEALALAAGDARLRVFLGVCRTIALSGLGRHTEAAAAADEAAGLLGTGAGRGWVARALAAGARARLDLGDVEGALLRSGHALQIRDQLGGVEEGEVDLFATHAAALRAAGRADEAAATAARGRARLEELASRIQDPAWRERFLQGPPAHREVSADSS